MKALRIFTPLLLVFFLLNYFSRKELPFAYADVADYNLLYTTANTVYIKKLEVVKDSLYLLFNGHFTENGSNKVSWRYSKEKYGTDTGSFIQHGNVLRYKPPPHKPQVVTMWVNGARPYSMNISYSPKAGFVPYELTSADLAIEPAKVREVCEWVPRDWEKDKRVDFRDVTQFVIDSAGISDNDCTAEKILKIGRLVIAGMPTDKGSPSLISNNIHPLKLYKEAKAGRVNVWCGDYAAIYSCFASSLGIPTRTVFSGIANDKLEIGNHVFCESYISEKDCWAYVDLTSNTVLLQQGDRYLNVVDVQRLLRYPGGIDKVSSYSVLDSCVKVLPFDTMSGNARYYFTQNAFFTFFYKDYFSKYQGAGAIQRIKNLLITRPMYAVYSDNLPGRNYHFFARILSNYLLVIATAMWLLLVALFVFQKIKMVRAHR